MKNNEQLQQADLPISLSLKIKFEGIIVATACRPSAILTRYHDDYQDDDDHPEGESSAKRQKTSECGTYSVEDARTDDEISDDKISQELVEEMSREIDEAKLQKAVNEMLIQRCNSGEDHSYHLDEIQNYLKNDIVWESRKERLTLPTPKKKAPVFFSFQRDPKAPPLTLMNQDLLYLKHGNLGPKKYTLSLHKFLVVPFPDDDMEERTSRATVIWERVHDFQLGMKSFQQKVNLTAPTITFSGIEELLEKLERYNKDVKYEYANPSPRKDHAEILRYYEEDIKDRLKYWDQMRRWEMYVNGRPLGSRRDRPVKSTLRGRLLGS
ncbi:hypothetical protein Tco_0421737 [Tanacetum coccineum]